MRKFTSVLAAVGLALAACNADKAIAQGGGGFGGGGGGVGGGNFDMSQMMKMVVGNMRETFEVTDDNEWGVVSEKLQKVMELRMQSSLGGMGMLGMMGRRGGRGGQGGGGGGRPGLEALAGSNPEGDALQRAIDAKAPNENLKGAIEKLVEARKKKQEALEKAQVDLKKLLTVRQEAIAYSLGVL